MVLAQDLRDAVLQAALQGKLTEQLETDSSVDEMLESIEEKKQLIKEKKIKKEKALPPIEKNDIPFEIPDSWRWIRLAEIGEIIGGGTPKTTESAYWDNGSISWITPADMNGCGMFIGKGSKSITEEGLNNSSAQLIPKDGVIISSRAPIGYIAIAENELTTSQGCKTFSAYNKIKILSKYIYFVIINSISDLTKRASGTTFKEISGRGVGETIIPLPPTEEQQRIVDRINYLMGKIDDYEKVEKELLTLEQKFPDDMKNSLLQAAMQGKLTEQFDGDSSVDEMLDAIKEEKKQLIKEKQIKKDKRLFNTNEIVALFDIPSSWKWTTLGNLVYKLTDGTHKTPKYTESGVKFVSVKDMSTGKLSLNNTKYISQEEHKELYERCNPEKGDILLSKVGTTGVPAIVDTDEQFSLFVSVALLKFNHKYINQKFFYYLIYSPLVQQQATENTKGIGNKNWVLDKIANTLVILPPVEEQQRIVERLEQLLPLCETL